MSGFLDKAKEAFEDAKDKVEEVAGEAKEKAEELVDKVRNKDDGGSDGGATA
jgi:uncharacterized protein YjbJ (UPF0337 family)